MIKIFSKSFIKPSNKKTIPNLVWGFTLVETLVATVIFITVSVGIYAGFANILKIMNILRIKEIMTNIANEQFEVARNLAYANIGTVNGIPSGIIPQNTTIVRDSKSFEVETVIRNVDDPFDGTFDGTPKDLSPSDMKMVEITITCLSCNSSLAPISFTTKISPKNLETTSTNGALVIKAFDAAGLPVSGADVNVINSGISPSVNLNDTTDINGVLTIVDARPSSTQRYRIIVTKDGYSTDRTYKKGGTGNPTNPTKQDVIVAARQITQVSFTIDRLSTINFKTLDNQCVATPNFDFTLSGSKLIGTNPNTIKYSMPWVTDSNGELSLSDIEWDTYNITGIDSVNDIIGTNPLLSLGVNPNIEQDMEIITAPKNGRRLMVVVRDQSTGLPVSDALVHVTGPNGYSNSVTTNEGFITQTDWSGGGGQTNFTVPNKFFDYDTNIDYSSSSGNLTLKKMSNYVSNGYLTSSTFDTGSISNFKQIIWNPVSQPVQTGVSSVRIQIATNNDNTTWNFLGPDGTPSSYYNSTNQNINGVHNGDRYIRYRLYLSTLNQSYTPNISDISFTYSSSCIPPGQVSFPSLVTGSYNILVTKSGYQNTSKNVSISNNWTKQEITISP